MGIARMPLSVLVTGATGFIAGPTIARLLADGHTVTATVRDPAKTERTAHLTALPGASDRLRLVAADLTDADPFTAHADVDAILHMASPYVVSVADPQRDLVDPAVQGTLSALRAASAHPRVRRVVLTSSVAAITDEPPDRVLTEADWNTSSSLTRNPYYLSKTLAERAAWGFMEDAARGFDLVVLNPFLVMGPSMTAEINTSNQTFVDMLKGTYPAIMALDWGVVDVRDVAAAHVAAMTAPGAEGRCILCAGNLTMADAAEVMRAEGYRGRLPKIDLSGPVGTAVMRLAALTQAKGTASYLRTHLGRHPRLDAAKSRRMLGLSYRDPRETLRDTLADLARWGHIARPVKDAG
jgi:dihydroflavonol-4-reductase